MKAISKPMNGAFVLNGSKVSEFLTRKIHTSSDAIRRFEERKAMSGKVDKGEENENYSFNNSTRSSRKD